MQVVQMFSDNQFHELMETIKYIAGGAGMLIFLWIIFKY